MTDDDRPAFVQAIGTLAIGLREKEPDVVQLRVYWDALVDLPVEFVVAAVPVLMRESWFPKVSEWRAAAQRVERDAIEAHRAVLRGLLSPLCELCSDTGWAPIDADGVRVVAPCECRHHRRREILGHAPWPLPAAPVDVTPPTTSDARKALKSLGFDVDRHSMSQVLTPKPSRHRERMKALQIVTQALTDRICESEARVGDEPPNG